MTRKSRLRAAVTRLAARTPEPEAPEDEHATAAPTLSVVVPVHDVESFLPECLDSLLDQTLTDLEIIAVDDGSTDGSLAVLEEYAERDPRLRVLSQANAGQGIARNEGVELARGEFLTFCDSDDVVPRGAYAHMVRVLRRSGSDFCVGGAQRFSHHRAFPTSWGAVHGRDRIGTTIDEFPAAMQDIIACNRMFRTEFWRDRVPPFRGHIAYEDHVPMLAAYVRAERFDVLARVTYRWRIREDNTSTGQQKANLENLLDRIAVKEEARAILLAEASTTAYDAWVARTLDVDFQPFMEPALVAGDMYRNVLGAVCTTMLGRAFADALDMVRFSAKVRAWLCARGEWQALVDADDHFRERGRLPAVRVEQGRVVADPGAGAPFRDLVPSRLWGLSRFETDLVAGLRDAVWTTEHLLLLRGFAAVRGLGSAGASPTVEAWLHDEASGVDVDVEARFVPAPWLNAVLRHANADYDGSGLEVTVDPRRLARASGSGASWVLRLRVDQDGVVREGGMHEVVDGSAATDLRARVLEDEALLLGPALGDEGLVLTLAPVAVLGELEAPAADRIRGRLTCLGDVDPSAVTVVLEHLPGLRRSSAAPAPDGRFEISLSDPDGGVRPLRGRLLAVLPGGDEVRVHPAAGPVPPADGSVHAGWRTDASGGLELVPDGRRLLVDDVALAADDLVLEVRGEGLGADDLRVTTFVCDDVELGPGSVEAGEGAGTMRVRFAKRTDRWGTGLPATPAPGGYALRARTADGTVLTAEPGPALRAELPTVRVDNDLRLNLRLRRSKALGLAVAPPLSQADSTPHGQRVLREGYRRSTAPAARVATPSVLFRSAQGAQVEGHPLALDRELAGARPDLVRYWGVHSHATPVPEGSVPVVIGSPDWYDVLRSVTHLCTDDDLEPPFEKRPHQRYLQTFRGRPFKALGRTHWHHLGHSEQRIAAELARRNRDWDAILAPDEAAAEVYRDELGFAGRVITAGSPRCDALVTADRAAVRRRVLAGLGIAEDATVVLHAPTYRDAMSPRVSTAGLVPELDLERLAAGLGPGHAVLLRAHPRDRRAAAKAAVGTPVINVTDHPDLTGLLQAADAAVLDYSSLRFDWALTRRPAVFFVPDRDRYFRVRPALGDWAPTAPGPQVSTIDDVVDHLSDLPALARAQADAVAALNATVNANEDGHAAARVVSEFFGD